MRTSKAVAVDKLGACLDMHADNGGMSLSAPFVVCTRGGHGRLDMAHFRGRALRFGP